MESSYWSAAPECCAKVHKRFGEWVRTSKKVIRSKAFSPPCLSALNKGLSFVPTTYCNEFNAYADFQKFFRTLRIKQFFNSDPLTETVASSPSPSSPQSSNAPSADQRLTTSFRVGAGTQWYSAREGIWGQSRRGDTEWRSINVGCRLDSALRISGTNERELEYKCLSTSRLDH
ncbi:hypothetical protein GJAV_G00178500 [Gymnothorax javanicus]|nr:hypothetical protein GJAV_G00178500 [Gymnothorax javanicus]